MKIVVILPTFNERENIIVLLDSLHQETKQILKHRIEYLVVDDASPDGTALIVREYSKKHPDVHIISGKKEGLGKALLRGMTYAAETLQADVLLQMDADLSHDPKKIPEFIQALDKGASMAIGSRYIPGGSIPSNWGLHRKIFSVLGNSVVRFGLGYTKVHDWTGGFRAFYKSYYESNKNEMEKYKGYVFQIAFLHKAIQNNAEIKEIPIQFTDRKFGRSKIAPSEYIRDVLIYVFSQRIKASFSGSFGKFIVVGGIGFIINALILKMLHDYFDWNASLANLVGAGAAIFSNFNLNNIWTFKQRQIRSVASYFIKLMQFYLTSAFGVICIQTGTIFIGERLFGETNYFLYFIAGTALLLVWNYLMYSKVIWKKNESTKNI